MRNKLIIAVLAALLFIPNLTADEKDVYAPFVSRLKAAVRGPQIKLTWKDSPDITGNYLVYRHTEDITIENFRNAVLIGRVDSGEESFIDAPIERGEFYYAVLAQTAEGKIFDIFIPFRNKTVKSISIESTAEEKDLAAVISGISVRVEQDRVEISFRASRADRNLILYRSTSPIFSEDQLSLSNIVRSLKSSETAVIDYPVPGIPYYYALVDEKLLESGIAVLAAGESASKDYAEIPLQKEEKSAFIPAKPETPAARPMPLPYFLLSREIGTGRRLSAQEAFGLPAAVTVSPETKQAVNELLAKALPIQAYSKQPRILEIDKALGTNKEEYTLRTILDGPFDRRNWPETEKQLSNFLSVHLSEEIRIRAYFYRAQALFFQDRHSESFMEFLLASSRFYPEVRPWLDEILRLRRLKEGPFGG
jgi:hypothetical protein